MKGHLHLIPAKMYKTVSLLFQIIKVPKRGVLISMLVSGYFDQVPAGAVEIRIVTILGMARILIGNKSGK